MLNWRPRFGRFQILFSSARRSASWWRTSGIRDFLEMEVPSAFASGRRTWDVVLERALRLELKKSVGVRPGDPQQKSVYFDTPGCDLSKRELSLRIRQSEMNERRPLKQRRHFSHDFFSRRMGATGHAVPEDPQAGPCFKRHCWDIIKGGGAIDISRAPASR